VYCSLTQYLLGAAVCLGGVIWLPAAAQAQSSSSVEFNRDIRPILSDKCFTCHGPDAANRKSKLRFDNETGAKIDLGKGRQSIVAGDPARSEVYQRITTDNQATRMPPAYAGREKLTAREIELFRRWIEQGAKWQAHWSFIPPKRPDLPKVRDEAWPRNPIDRFMMERLEREGMTPAPEADRPTLIRRVSLDLTGLPPSPAEVDAFVKDSSQDAYEKVVDRLLASPRYAERMAYRWMEAARYADTNGYQMDGVRDMWRWRDWVIDAFHRNMPFDEFTVEQIAGDLLPNPTLEQRIATGFHRNHRTNAEGGIVPEEFRVEYVADRAETTSAVWLGLTLGCARCHDHKYDPFKQKEFYQLFAFFNNVPEKGLVYNWGNEPPYIKAPTPEQQHKLEQLSHTVTASEQRFRDLEPKLSKAQRRWEKKVRRGDRPDWTITEGLVFRQKPAGSEDKVGGCEKDDPDCKLPLADGLTGKSYQFDGKRFVEAGTDIANFDYLDPFTFAAWIKPQSPNGAILSHTEDYAEGSGHGLYVMDGKIRLHVVFRWTDIGLRVETVNPVKLDQWQHVLVTYDGKHQASGVHFYINGQPQEMKVLFDELNWPMDFKVPFRIGAGSGMRFKGQIEDVRVYKIALTPAQAGVIPLRERVSEIAAMPPESRIEAQRDKLRFCFLEQAVPKKIRAAYEASLAARKERDRFEESIPTVMVMVDSAKPRDTFVLKRGAYDNPGEKVTPGVPAVLPRLRPEWPRNRLGLARWLVDRGNPLTARVTVNRFWQMYFGTGLVKTVEDFGSQGEWPTHLDLLDWLAVEFMDSGWNVKSMQKTIVTSATYRQSSRATPELIQKDPENRLLARGPRLRLGPEMIRDEALSVSGLLVEKTGGPSVKPYQPPGLWQELGDGKGYVEDKGEGLYRRSLYSFWKRTIAPPFMMNFDSPSRETCTVRETRTNTPLQALDLMNDVAFLEASRKLAERILREGGSSPEARIDYAYRVVLARPPRPAERQVVLETLNAFEKRYSSDPKAGVQFLSQGESPRDEKLDPAELAAYSTVASLVLNLDEAVTKQ
jgi:mono/diheme cytochrome c family protein